jgi:hypothetical protein
MAEVLIEAANYSIKKKRIEEKKRESIKVIEDLYRPRIGTIVKRYKDIIVDIERRELENYKKNSETFVNPFLYLSEWLKESEGKFRNPLKNSILEEAIEEYKNFPSNSLINLSSLLEDIKKRVEERVSNRLKYIERNMFSQIENEKSNFEKEMESLNQVLKEAEKISKDYGFKLEIKEDGSELITQSKLNFSSYLEKLVYQGLNIRDWKVEGKKHKAIVGKDNENLFIEYDENSSSLSFHIPLTNEIEKYVKVVDLLLSNLKFFEAEKKEEDKAKEVAKKKKSKLLKWF